MIEHPLEPIIDEQCEVLILGSFPSVKSREISFYYGHPQNRFWKIIGTITQTDYETIEDKKNEFMMLGFRMIEGVDIADFKAKFVDNPLYVYREKIKKLTDEGLIEVDLNNIKLTNKGLDLANVVFEEFI